METTQIPINRFGFRRCELLHHRILLGSLKKWNNDTCSNMDEPSEYHAKWSKSDKDRYFITNMFNLKNSANESTYKTDLGLMDTN